MTRPLKQELRKMLYYFCSRVVQSIHRTLYQDNDISDGIGNFYHIRMDVLDDSAVHGIHLHWHQNTKLCDDILRYGYHQLSTNSLQIHE